MSKIVKRADRYIINRTHPAFSEIDSLSHRCSLLRNQVLRELRDKYFGLGRYLVRKYNNNKIYPNYNELEKKHNHSPAGDAIGNRKVAQSIIKHVRNQEFGSFLALYRRYISAARPPKYTNRETGRSVIILNSQTHRPKQEKIGLLEWNLLPKLSIPILNNRVVKEVSITPRNGYYLLLVHYDVALTNLPQLTDNTAAIDLGVNNLAALVSSCGISNIYSGEKLLKINSQYNYEINKAKSELPNGVFSSKKIHDLWKRRENKIRHEMHHISKEIVELLLSKGIKTLFVGKNKNWKQHVNMGKRNNRKFVSIPFNMFIQMLKYKLEMFGIELEETQESYTSKASAIDRDQIPAELGKGYVFSGIRKTRDVYVSKNGIECDADMNAAINILRKTNDKIDKIKDYIKWVIPLITKPTRITVVT